MTSEKMKRVNVLERILNNSTVGFLPSSDTLSATLLSRLAYNIDLTQTQYDRARSAYESVSAVLAADARWPLKRSTVFPQGSFALGTVVKPVDESADGFDVDVVCRLAATVAMPPAQAKALIGSCLGADGRYTDKLEEKSRCWRLTYAGEFHLDLAPLVANDAGGDWIPDRELRRWIATHPAAFAAWFNRLADLAQTQRLIEGKVLAADIAPFPADPAQRGWLRRLVQLLKRHRCIWKETLPSKQREYAPISIIITTLATYAFARVHDTGRFANPLDLLRAIVVAMPTFIEQRVNAQGALEWWVPSPVASENFANRWNQAHEWAETFGAWHGNLISLFDKLESAEGIDGRIVRLREAFGETAANSVARDYADHMTQARNAGELRLTSASGLVAGSAVAGTTVRPHTFYGG